jgi:fused signal recognition particle receptor
MLKNLFSKISESLDKTKKNIESSVGSVLSGFAKLDEQFLEQLEESLIMSDIGAKAATYIIEKIRKRIKSEKLVNKEQIKSLIVDELIEILTPDDGTFIIKPKTIILIIGVNGVGKTTSVAKLAKLYKDNDKSVLVAAADTFRAAAIDQLEIWTKKAKVNIIKQQEGSDPAAVIYDAVKAANSRSIDVLICDTAGRLHNKKNLMEELRKIYRVINKECIDANLEVFLTLDATIGQNAISQTKSFSEIIDITGIILTKLDSSAKGGVVISIKNESNIPIRYIGLGEGIDDLKEFDPRTFVEALF